MKKATLAVVILCVATVFATADAIAVDLFFGAPSATDPLVGETFTITVRMDTEGDTQINGVGVSVFADPAIVSFVEGTSPGQILFNPDTFEGIARVSQPFTLETDPDGLVRAASFASLSPSGIASADQLLATLTFQAVGAGPVVLDVLLAQGDDIISDGVGLKNVPGAVTFQMSEPITVPEPASYLLSFAALGSAWLVTRRRGQVPLPGLGGARPC